MEIGNKNVALAVELRPEYYEHVGLLAVYVRVGKKQINMVLKPFCTWGVMFQYWNIKKNPIEVVKSKYVGF